MKQYFVVLMFVAALLAAASEALSTVANPKHAQSSVHSTRLNDRLKRNLRTSNEDNTDAEERAILGEKALLTLSKVAEKKSMPTLSQKLKDKAWLVGKRQEHKAWLKAGASPTSKWKEYNWKGISWDELKRDQRYIRYQGFDDVWRKAQEKKGTLHTVDAWIQLMKDEAKKRPAV
ncbi:hypothetical protein PR003_g16974 [Phytophthora rubi]|uniref:RxLR effector protein n=1 Tax=Phytophthora rubi TaxID=129364 RepID=A0A6A3N0P2_9STRA|nr:hypothetical protein PR002_g6439 [Phytophthora rubi]KAE9042334.1 hypothetical protein PR001_g6230 [Phytophthora rubi]KAE9323454.1 hypothetical protein PR003_g16974 [Phytophthora rubi]